MSFDGGLEPQECRVPMEVPPTRRGNVPASDVVAAAAAVVVVVEAAAVIRHKT